MFHVLSTFAVISFEAFILKSRIDARVFSNTFQGDYNSSPSDT